MIDLFADDCSPLTGLRRLALAHLVAKFRATWPGLAAAAGLPAGRPGAVREVIAHRAFYQIGTYIYLSAWARRELARAAPAPDPLAGVRAAVARATNVATVAEALAHARRASR
jgi:hypothetical protein